ncbi:tyrosine-type recombinase/integrase [Streptomyces sp. AN091965]|uniref:tyrosine-type recombinase/integrase n=1 Tax=Streptomyces sp. AN091965 TaxID=2927803 RepID=UPI001F61F838|nr:site-specific integrase [Streptomyces sp. AN091965]MCI3929206.1 site-specific integrase [Streptomyces sp. AN091965]
MALAVVQDLRQACGLPTPEELEDFETDVLSGFVLARASAGLTDGAIQGDLGHLEKVRDWFGRPLWEMESPHADAYFGKTIRHSSPSLRAGRAGAISVFFDFLELRHRAALHQLTGRLVECPLDEMNRPRASAAPQLRIPPTGEEIEQLFAGWRDDLACCRKFAPAARNYTVARLSADVGLRVNEARMLDLDDVRWELGRFGKLNVRFGKGSRRSGPRQRVVPMINGADLSLRWYVEDVSGHFGADLMLPGAALFPSERFSLSGRARTEVFRTALTDATARHLLAWAGKLTPYVLRHFCAS